MSVRHVCSVLGLTSAIYLGVSAQHAELDGTNIVENLVLTYSRNARLEKGKRMKQAIPGQRCVHMPKIASQISQISQNAFLRCRVERCSDVDGHQTGVQQLFATRYRCNSGCYLSMAYMQRFIWGYLILPQ